MSIFGKLNGNKVKVSPRCLYNGVIVTPKTGWTKVNGVKKKIWDIMPSDCVVNGGTINITMAAYDA